jgi:hypothetical protein
MALLLFASINSFSAEKAPLAPIDLACKKLQSFFADTLETCKNQKNYKKFVEDLEEVECPRFTHSFFIVLRTVLENDPYKKDATCFDKETFDSNLADSLVNELEVKYSKEFLQLARYSKLSRESFMKLPLTLLSYNTLIDVAKTFPASSEDRKKLMTLALNKIGAAHRSKKISPDVEKTFQYLEEEAAAKRKAWSSVGFYGVSGCKVIEKAFVVVPEEKLAEAKEDVALKSLMEIAALQPTGGEIDPPFAQPSAANLKVIHALITSEAVSTWSNLEKMETDQRVFEKSVEAKNVNWLSLRRLITKALQKHEYEIDLSAVNRCSSN